MTEVTAARVTSIAVTARIPLSQVAAERVSKAVTPIVARLIDADIQIAFEVEPATFAMVARRGASA